MGLYELTVTLDDPLVTRFVSLYGSIIYKDKKMRPEERAELERLVRQLGNGNSRRMPGTKASAAPDS
jgi:hypothetical protein